MEKMLIYPGRWPKRIIWLTLIIIFNYIPDAKSQTVSGDSLRVTLNRMSDEFLRLVEEIESGQDQNPEQGSLKMLTFEPLIECWLSFSDYREDIFQTRLGSFTPYTDMRNIRVVQYSPDGTEIYNPDVDFEKPESLWNFSFSVSTGEHTDFMLYIRYNFVGFPFFRSGFHEWNIPRAFMFFSNVEPWIPVSEGLYFEYVIIKSPAGYTPWVSYPLVTTGREEEGLKVSRYRRNSESETSEIHLTILDDYLTTVLHYTDPDISVYLPADLEPERIGRIDLDMAGIFEKMSRVTDSAHARRDHVDILGIYWRSDDNELVMGQALGDYILCDISFIEDRYGLVHELSHFYLPAESISKETPAYFFLSESLVEWFCGYVMEGEWNKSVDYQQNNYSLYEITVNNEDTWQEIYGRGPALLQTLAAETGSEKLARCIDALYHPVIQGKSTYSDFLDILRTNGVEESAVSKLDQGVRALTF